MKSLPRFSGLVIFIMAMNVLVLEITLTRIFSVMTYHHFTYLIISLTLLGFGAAGTILTINRHFGGPAINPKLLADCAWLFSLLTMICFIAITKINFDAMRIYNLGDYTQIFWLFLLLILTTIPFLLGGLCIGYLVSKSHDHINRLYFFDLLGAALGSLFSIVAINYLGATSTIFWTAFAGCMVAIALISGAKIRLLCYLTTAVTAAIIGTITLINDNIIPVPFPPSKRLESERMEHRWHVIARVDVGNPVAGYPNFGGKLSRMYTKPKPPLGFRYILQDGIAPTGIIKLENRDLRKMKIFGYYLQACPYVIKREAEALVIGPGGGVDVAIALHEGSKHATAVDINPWIIDYVRNKYNKFAGGLYRRPDVTVVCAEGRHFLTLNGKKYDVIQLSGVDTFSALASGAYALTENYLYTMEAISLFLDHLRHDGILSFSRWLFTPPRETLRLAVTARTALEKRGVAQPERNILVVAGHRNDDPWAETLIKPNAFTPQEVKKIEDWAQRLGFDVIYNPLPHYERSGRHHSRPTKYFNPDLCSKEFENAIRKKGKEFTRYLEAYFYNIKPTVDDAPFFFNFYKLRSLLTPFKASKGGYPITRLPLGLLILFVCFVLIVILGGLFILLPFLGRATSLHDRKGALHILIYFACIGLAFMAIEIIFLQKLMVFLGGPVYSMAVTLFSLLVFCGIGSYIARIIDIGNIKSSGKLILTILIIVLIATILILNYLVPGFMRFSHAIRCLIAVIILMPLGLLMGMPFPTGIRIAESMDENLVPWAWCVNACATVLSSIASILLAMFIGLTNVAYGAVFAYFVALLAIPSATHRETANH